MTVWKIWLVIRMSIMGKGREPGTGILSEEWSSQGGRVGEKNGKKSVQNLGTVTDWGRSHTY